MLQLFIQVYIYLVLSHVFYFLYTPCTYLSQDTHPHQADIACLNRQANIHDVVVAHNPHSAYAMTEMMRHCLERGVQMPSFFKTKKSPSVAAYTKSQSGVLNETSKN